MNLELVGFAYERHAHQQVACYLLELVNPGRGSLSRVSEVPDVKAS